MRFRRLDPAATAYRTTSCHLFLFSYCSYEERGEAVLMNHEPHEPHERMIHGPEAFEIQGAIFEVNRLLGAGFLEAVYQEALALEFAARGIPFVAKPVLSISYKGTTLAQSYSPDFICFERVIVELKAVSALAVEHRAQVINYLNATRLRLGLLVNFGCAPKARIERLAL